jgi:SAM-dependent methyltransferase
MAMERNTPGVVRQAVQERPTGERLCWSCGTAAAIELDEPLWPADWRCLRCGKGLTTASGFVQLAPELDEADEGFALTSFDHLPRIEIGHFWFVSRNELIAWLVRRFARESKRVLELGCGTGFVIHALRAALPGARITGSELHSRGLTYARKRHGTAVELVQMDARASGLRSAVDLVGAFDVLEHIPDDERVLAEIYSMLKPDGVLIATVPQHPWMWSSADDLAHHWRRYRLGELARKARSAGLEPRYQSGFISLAFPLMIALRGSDRLRAQKRTAEQLLNAEFQMPRCVNAALLALCRLEHTLRKVGLKFPFGGSQVLVAQRPSA